MWLRTRCDLTFDISVTTPMVLMLRPRSGAQQWVAEEEYRITPDAPILEFTDVYGNLCQRLIASPGTLSIHTNAEVNTSELLDQAPGAHFVEIQNLPDTLLGFLLPSRYCESDRFSQMTTEITTGAQMGYDQVSAITDWLRNNIHYHAYGSNLLISATEVHSRQSGVCRDLAHLGIAMCRSICIPARMVVGYLYGLEPMDLHAWFEAYVGDRWYAFDATQPQMRGGYVAIGYGRDAADVAVFNQFGPSVYPASQQISVDRLNDNRMALSE